MMVLTAPKYGKMFERNPLTAQAVSVLRDFTAWGGFGGPVVDVSRISAFSGPIIGGTRGRGFSGFGAGKSCTPTEDGLAKDPIARVFGCPDCPGMAAIAGTTKYTFCYWIKRPMGQIGAVAVIAGAGFLIYKLASGSG